VSRDIIFDEDGGGPRTPFERVVIGSDGAEKSDAEVGIAEAGNAKTRKAQRQPEGARQKPKPKNKTKTKIETEKHSHSSTPAGPAMCLTAT
jgi:hypothetical protein